jgi:hypothetical protein
MRLLDRRGILDGQRPRGTRIHRSISAACTTTASLHARRCARLHPIYIFISDVLTVGGVDNVSAVPKLPVPDKSKGEWLCSLRGEEKSDFGKMFRERDSATPLCVPRALVRNWQLGDEDGIKSVPHHGAHVSRTRVRSSAETAERRRLLRSNPDIIASPTPAAPPAHLPYIDHHAPRFAADLHPSASSTHLL